MKIPLQINKKKDQVSVFKLWSSWPQGKFQFWLKYSLQDNEGHESPIGTSRESERPKRYSGYVAYMKNIIQDEPSTFE